MLHKDQGTGKNYRLFAYFEHIRSNGVSKDCVSCKLDKAVLCSAQRKNKEKSSEKRRKRKQHRRLYTTSAALPSPLLRRYSCSIAGCAQWVSIFHAFCPSDFTFSRKNDKKVLFKARGPGFGNALLSGASKGAEQNRSQLEKAGPCFVRRGRPAWRPPALHQPL
ncbi:DNA polymerase theta [Trichinella spiralis]|uniref:DNA polymerase theta n=1 Tax=Trichinella spiralis TaxID=6334 RepID=A0ABR3K678_TRISP